MNETKEITGRKAFDRKYQDRVGQFARKELHDNTIELVKKLEENDLLKDSYHYFEIGAGGARNLYYIWNKNNNIKISCNDFWEEESKHNMHPDIKDIINFYEGDTEVILENFPKDLNVDVLLSSDHFMHLPINKAEGIISSILNIVKPKYIVLRERKKQFQNPEAITFNGQLYKSVTYPRYYHNYERFETKYDLINEYDCDIKEYFIRIYKSSFIKE